MTKTTNGTPIFHADHGVESAFDMIDAYMDGLDDGFFIGVMPLPVGTGIESALYGPTAGDSPVPESDVEYVVRGNRSGPSRLVARPKRPADHLVVIGIAGEDPKVFTAYGSIGPDVAPREPWDKSLSPSEREESRVFWSEHALAQL